MSSRPSLAIAGALWIASGASPASASEPVSHHGDALVRVEAPPDQVHELGLDVWTHRAGGLGVLARVTPQQWPVLDASGLAYALVEPDLGPRLDAERDRLARVAPLLGGGLDPAFHSEYRDLVTVLDRLDALALARPERVSVVEVGRSLQGRPIRGIRIRNPEGPADRPVVLVQGAQHAREWISVAATVFAAERLATAPAGGALDALLDRAELLVVPVVNPDGYVYSWEVERLWRKNRRDGIGVDLNRNWSVAWGGKGASAEPEKNNYRGAAPFSEPESSAMRELIDAEPNMIALLDVHAYGQMVLYPWGYELVDAPDDALLHDLALGMADPMGEPHQQWYAPQQSASLYPASGNAIDWAYGVHGIHAIALELRPTVSDDWGFILPPEQIVPTGEELVIAISSLVESAVQLGPGEPGDSGSVDSTGAHDTTGTEPTAGTGPAGAEGSTGRGEPLASSGAWPRPPILESTGEDEPSHDEGGSGCECRTSGGVAAWWWLWLGLAPLRRRRW